MAHRAQHFRRRLPYQIRNAVDATALVAMLVALILLARGCANTVWPDHVEVVAERYAPVTLKDLRVEPTIIIQGGEATLWDGLCNESADPVRWTYTLAVRSTATAGIVAAGTRIVVAEQKDPRVLDAGECLPDHYTGPVGDQIPPGQWELSIQITVQGPGPEDVQNLDRVSPPFEVRGAQ